MTSPARGNAAPASAEVAHFSAARVRQDFLEFFAARGHKIVPSAPVFPRDDPTLLFTNAGMNQFKDVFLGTGRRDYKRAADTQKCIRVSGKHNDLEEVGVDTYHHTFFEMLGNWSFGDYFKEEAIQWAWELLTKTWGLPPERLWVTVFGGDEKDRLPADTESERLWIEAAGVAPSRVLRFGRKDNFWEMGDTGPCGPCTEIHIDRGEKGTDARDGADRNKGVNAGNERFMEIWNLVFIQYNRLEDGSLRDLPAKHVDTGMGFERVVSVLQGRKSNYDTDLFASLFARIASLALRNYGSGASADVAFRVIADHARAVTSAISDGAMPSNEGRGYVLRRLIRRASRFGRQALALEQPFLCEVVPAVAEVLGETFPEMRQRCDHVQSVVRAEEEQFGRTLGRGLVLFEDLAAKVQASGSKMLSGEKAYDLYATYGFPQDLVELMAREMGLTVDAKGWDAARTMHQDASRSSAKSYDDLTEAERQDLLDKTAQFGVTRLTCHDPGERAYRVETQYVWGMFRQAGSGTLPTDEVVGMKGGVCLAETPFYPEGGGQVGDQGVIRSIDGKFEFRVRQTVRAGSLILHRGQISKADGIHSPGVGARVVAEVDREPRDKTRKNHTATHLLHKALKEVLGAHATQQGSYVGPDRLRFDYSHGKALSSEEIERIEAVVNEKIFDNAPVRTTIEDLEAAKARGVTAMFGEKYEDKVRVLDVGGWSLELCGGTHVSAAGDIGPFLILSERAIQAGVRRIEALTGPAAVEEIQRQRRILREAAMSLKSAPEEVPVRILALQKEAKEAKKKTAATSAGDVAQSFESLRTELREAGGVSFGVVDAPGLDLAGIRDLADRGRTLAPRIALALFGREEDRVPWVIVLQGVGSGSGRDARELGKIASGHLGGGGGGKPELAQGQGKQATRLPDAMREIEGALQKALNAT